MKNVDLYGRVRHAVLIDGMSSREAARVFGVDPRTVRHQRFWFQRPRKLGEYLTHLVDSIMRRVCGVASAGFQVFCV